MDHYVPVNFATRLLMRGVVEIFKGVLRCSEVMHCIGREGDANLKPACVMPLWVADNTLVHDDPAAAPDITEPQLPSGMDRTASRAYFDRLWTGGAPDWTDGGPTFTFQMWGPAQYVDLRGWVLQRLPILRGQRVPLQRFSGPQAFYGVIYELKGDPHEVDR